MTKKVAKALLYVLGAFLTVYLVYQGYMMAYPTYKTQVAMIETISDSIPAVGIVVRDETVIDGSIAGGEVRRFLVNSGDKVAKDSIVAVVYQNSADARDALALSICETLYQSLTNSMDTGYTSGTNLETLKKRINQTAAEIAVLNTQGDYQNSALLQNHLLEMLNSYEYATGHEPDSTLRKDELDTLIQAYEAYNIEPSNSLRTPVEGYFIASTDGYEIYNSTSIADLTAKDIQELANPQNLVRTADRFKVISGYSWKYVAVIDSRYASRIKAGMDLLLDFHYSSVRSLPVKVESVTAQEDTDKTVVVLSCEIMNAAISGLRVENADISFRNYKGFVIERSVLRMEEGEVGVYVKFGSIVEFKKLNIIYQNDDYVVSSVNSMDTDYLRLYDEVFIEGKDLYNGKDLR